jgi:exonuclease-1
MGIQGLLPLLKPIQKQAHLKDFSGQAVGVDAYVWLHRASFGCAYDLCLGKPTKRYVTYCMTRVKLLQDNGIWPIIVFDGDRLPMKKGTEQSRKEYFKLTRNREAKRKLGMEYHEKGDRTKALECFQACVDITTEMAFEWIQVLLILLGIEKGKYRVYSRAL